MTKEINTEKKKSTNKTTYIKQKSFPSPFQLAARDLPKLVSHYNKIPILINGCTPQGQHIINSKKANWQKVAENFSKYPEATYITQNWLPQNDAYRTPYSSPRIFLHRDNFPNLTPLMQKFFKEAKVSANFSFRNANELTEEQLNKLQDLCKNNKFTTEIKKTIEPKEKEYETRIKEMIGNVGLDKQEVQLEMLEIQKHLASTNHKGFVAYVHTGGNNAGEAHMEYYLISGDCIIKPICWFQQSNEVYLMKAEDLVDQHNRPFYQNNPSFFLAKDSQDIFPEMQAGNDSASCGHLVSASMKQHLKEEQNQLNNLTLRFRFYDANGQLQYYFLPSPQSIRYSQSTRYINYINQIVTEDKPFEIIASENSSSPDKSLVNPIKTVLTKSIEIAQQNGENGIAKENQDILDALPEFREKWKSAYKPMMDKRQELQSGKYNYSLLYRGHKNEKIIQNTKETKNIVNSSQILEFPEKNEWTVQRPVNGDIGEQKLENFSNNNETTPLIENSVAMPYKTFKEKIGYSMLNFFLPPVGSAVSFIKSQQKYSEANKTNENVEYWEKERNRYLLDFVVTSSTTLALCGWLLTDSSYIKNFLADSPFDAISNLISQEMMYYLMITFATMLVRATVDGMYQRSAAGVAHGFVGEAVEVAGQPH